MSKRNTIKVYAKRGDHKVYTYIAFASVKASKALDLAIETASDIAAHETRSGMYGNMTIMPNGVKVSIDHGRVRFLVRVM